MADHHDIEKEYAKQMVEYITGKRETMPDIEEFKKDIASTVRVNEVVRRVAEIVEYGKYTIKTIKFHTVLNERRVKMEMDFYNVETLDDLELSSKMQGNMEFVIHRITPKEDAQLKNHFDELGWTYEDVDLDYFLGKLQEDDDEKKD